MPKSHIPCQTQAEGVLHDEKLHGHGKLGQSQKALGRLGREGGHTFSGEKLVMSIYGGPAPHESCHKLKLIGWVINSVSMATPEYLRWSEPCMAAYRQEVRRLEEKFDGFELHHILRCNNEATEALAQLGLSRESPPLGVFAQDLFKPSIRLKEDTPAIAPGTSPSEGASVLAPGTSSGRQDPTVMLGAYPRASAKPSTPNLGQTKEMVAAVRLPSRETDW
jgi:hypothetical protein